MRRYLLMALPFVVSLAAATSARAAVVSLNSKDYGVALVPNAREGNSTTPTYLMNAGIPIVTSTGPCADPAAGTEPDILSAGSWPLNAPIAPICWHGGAVMHANETFTLEWEGQAPNTYWSKTKNYVHTYLSDVAAASGSLNSPYADTTQYWDGPSVSDRAAYKSAYGGGCDDNGTANCKFGSSTGSGPGNPLPNPRDCPVSGDNFWGGNTGGLLSTVANNLCLTDSDIRNEVISLVNNDGLVAHTQPGYAPLVVVLTPPGVEVCLDSAGNLCSANGRLAPPQPTVTTTGSGGTVTAGTYSVVETYITSSGETVASAPASVTTTGSISTITITSPPPHSGVTGWYAYVTSSNGTVYQRQGGSQTIGQDLNLTAPPANSGIAPPTKPASFCSYHSQVVDPQSNQAVTYVVQPWSAFTICTEPDVPTLPANSTFTPDQLSINAGEQLVSPLSQAQIAAVVNPGFTGWFGLDGLEINDQAACQPLSRGLDNFTIGSSSQNGYVIQREFNNAAVVDSDPYTYGGCVPSDVLNPAFVSPSAINLGDTLDLDGSDTATSLAIPNANYSWDFGDGSTGTGPSVAHTYGQAGTYTVKLTVTDRGGNTATLTQPVQVLSQSGLPVPPPSPVPTSGSGGGAGSGSSGSLNVKLQLMPQALHALLARGVTVQVTSSEPADGFATISISRKAARRAHINAGSRAVVIVGTGTVSGLKDGTVMLRLRMTRTMASKLAHLKHLTLTVRLALVDKSGNRAAVNVAGSY